MTAEHNPNHIELTAAEISSLWTAYQEVTANICGITFFLIHVEDSNIRRLLEKYLEIEKDSKQKIEQIFQQKNHPVPLAFSEKEVNFDAPRLFSDKLYLEYILNMTDLSLRSEERRVGKECISVW